MAHTPDHGAAGLSRRAVAVAVAVIALAFAAGALALGLDGDPSPVPTASTTTTLADGCREQPLRFTVTNDQREVDRQLAFERAFLRGKSELPPVGFHSAQLDPTASLHAASHSWIVVYYAEGIADGQLAGLRALFQEMGKQKLPTTASPRPQRPALVAVRNGVELTCEEIGGDQVEQVRRFTAALYPSLTA